MSRHLRYSLLAAALGFPAGCAPTLIEGDADGVTVENRSSLGIGVVGVELGYLSERARELALETADRHCMQYGKRARLAVRGHNAYRFECFAGSGAAAGKDKG